MLLNGLGLSAPAVTVTAPLTVAAVSPLPGPTPGLWQASLQIPTGQGSGGIQVSLSAGGVPMRDANLVVWVK
jgi:hypothetical protein